MVKAQYRSPLARRRSTSRLGHWCSSGDNLERGRRHPSLCTDHHRVLEEKGKKRFPSVPVPKLSMTHQPSSCRSEMHPPMPCSAAQWHLPQPPSIPCFRYSSSHCKFSLRKNKAYPSAEFMPASHFISKTMPVLRDAEYDGVDECVICTALHTTSKLRTCQKWLLCFPLSQPGSRGTMSSLTAPLQGRGLILPISTD